MRNLKLNFKVPKPKVRVKTVVNRVSGVIIPKKDKKEKYKKRLEDYLDD